MPGPPIFKLILPDNISGEYRAGLVSWRMCGTFCWRVRRGRLKRTWTGNMLHRTDTDRRDDAVPASSTWYLSPLPDLYKGIVAAQGHSLPVTISSKNDAGVHYVFAISVADQDGSEMMILVIDPWLSGRDGLPLLVGVSLLSHSCLILFFHFRHLPTPVTSLLLFATKTSYFTSLDLREVFQCCLLPTVQLFSIVYQDIRTASPVGSMNV